MKASASHNDQEINLLLRQVNCKAFTAPLMSPAVANESISSLLGLTNRSGFYNNIYHF